jgi:tetratricopeptide (TPR) repeat protein
MKNLAISYYQVGRQREAIKLLKEELALSNKINGQGNPDTVETMNALAWDLATSRDSAIRDGAAAVYFGEKAVVATNQKNPSIIDTLAAAYAETGQFDKAVAAENQAIALLQDGSAKAALASRLALYQTNTPYRDPEMSPR